jgi:hypothetical protein
MPHLIPFAGLQRLARHYEYGVTSQGYAPRNWEKGIPLWRYFDGIIRHAYQWLNGEVDEDHMAAVAWNAFGIMHHEEEIAKGNLPMSLADQLPDSPKIDAELLNEQVEALVNKAYNKGLGQRKLVTPGEGPMFVYIAAKLSSKKGQRGEDINMQAAVDWAARIAAKGHYAFAPHPATLPVHRAAKERLPYGYWLALDHLIIVKCADALYRGPGASVGADYEVQLAEKLGIPVYHHIEDLPDESASLQNHAATREEFADRVRASQEAAPQTSPSRVARQ